ncbi:hypothetical protein GCK32_021703 [Trichostrongylus colubriformis]|uniref:Uncharacterized protein n=2 Tax=Trichostrongylus colubriformis TaxID=6319 RepID=A0AAN8FJP0_TRICO
MPFGDPPDYVHLRTNESQMQLISMGEQPETPSASPCFNSPSTRDEPPAVVFVPGKVGRHFSLSNSGDSLFLQ